MQSFAQKQNQPQIHLSSSRARSVLATATPHRFKGSTLRASSGAGHDLSKINIHSSAAGTIQTKLAINKDGDEYEQEADHVSEHVMRMPEPQLQRAYACGGGCSDCQIEPPNQRQERLQTRRIGSSQLQQSAIPPIVQEVLSSPGQPLDAAARDFMEPRFGHDFSQVRVHADAKAAESARAVNALAYTVGGNVVFGDGQYAPGTTTGKRLLAHELTHVVQQAAPGGNSNGLSKMVAPDSPGGAFLQRKMVDEPAGGCGICNPASVVGTAVHKLVQLGSFPAAVQNEFPIESISDKENGRLDLLEYFVDNARGTVDVNIGEIKPNNPEGIKEGVKDLLYYEQQVRDLFRVLFPDSRVTVGRLDIQPSPPVLIYIERTACPQQMVEVEDIHDGLYGYNCDPPNSTVNKSCCKPDDDQDDLHLERLAALFMQAGMDLSTEEMLRSKESRRLRVDTRIGELGKQQPPESPPPENEPPRKRGSSSTGSIGTWARRAANVALVTRIAVYTLDVFNELSDFSYSSAYRGTQGAKLKRTFERLGTVVSDIANAAQIVEQLDEQLTDIRSVDSSDEQATAQFRAYMFEQIVQLGAKVDEGFNALNDALDSSAIKKRIDQSDLSGIELSLSIARDAIKSGDDSTLTLPILKYNLMDAADWLTTRIERLFDDHKAIVYDDAHAWLAGQD